MTDLYTSVFVSGATGFAAQHIVKLLIEKGYNVVGSVRSKEKGDKLKKLLDSKRFTFEIIEDIEPVGAFDEALKKHPEVTVFLHTASPFHFKISNTENELLKPAINGTKNALNAIKTYGPQVKHVVVTSSYAAMMDLNKEDDPTFVTTEKLWNPITWDEANSAPGLGYVGSKTFAERAAWDFVKSQTPNFKLNCVNPTYIFGPQAFEVKEELNTSSEIINSFLKLTKSSEVPGIAGSFVDVRDVAKAHLAAFELNLSNKRLLTTSSKFNGQDILDILNKRFDILEKTLPIGNPGSGKSAARKTCQIDNSETCEILGVAFIGLETSVVDTISQILRARAEG